MNKKLIGIAIIAVIGIVFLIAFNPFAWNDAGNRTIVERASGEQFVQYQPGVYYAGLWAKLTEWPNQISVSYKDSVADYEIKDGTIEIGRIGIRFNDATTADIGGIVQYILPSDEREMIAMHNAHRTPQSLVTKRLMPYTKECLQSSAQLMSSEMHYGGGRAQMAQDFSDQLKTGVFLLTVNEVLVYDSLEKEKKRVYQTQIQKDKNGQVKHKNSSIKEYGITVADAAITDVDYQLAVDNMLAKKIEASTKASISKQELMTAQQQALTEKAKGEKTLVETEYRQRVEQTKQVVAAETKVALAKQDALQQSIQADAAVQEARKIKTLADAKAYEKRTAMMANGALEQKLDAYKTVMGYIASAIENCKNPLTPTYMVGGNGGGTNAAQTFFDIQNAKAMKDLGLNMNMNAK